MTYFEGSQDDSSSSDAEIYKSGTLEAGTSGKRNRFSYTWARNRVCEETKEKDLRVTFYIQKL